MADPADHGDAAPRRPSLLPAFEPFSSSPGLPRVAKRKFDGLNDDRQYYPTPVPTSSTGVLPSSPFSGQTRPILQRAVSTLSERAPLGDVPTLDLHSNGEPVLMGRSSNSSDYQLSANRHISRVHVRASYHAADAEFPAGKVEVECLGWNGARVHCRGEIVELAKGECFTSDKPMAQIMVDVQDTRVMLVWPKEGSREPPSIESRSPWALESPTKRRMVSAPQFASSPPAMLPPRPRSPISPTPVAGLLGSTFNSTFRGEQTEEGPVQVYEDDVSDAEAPGEPTPVMAKSPVPTSTTLPSELLKQSRSTNGAEPEEFSEHDEENDPIVHSFGPFGENILDRFQSFQPRSPERKRKPLKRSFSSPSRSKSAACLNVSPVKNHVINQLAYSRVHALPLSTIHSNLPSELRGAMAKPSDTEAQEMLTSSDLKTILDEIPCVGEISREGKDAAGKLLESEFYYVPEMDGDSMRRETVTQSLGKTSIRAARKQHKQYYWKRPRNQAQVPLPLLVWHGLGDRYDADGLHTVGKLANKVHPGTYVYYIRLDEDGGSDRSASFFGNVTAQVAQVCEDIKQDPKLEKDADGVIRADALGFSQGGQFLRGLIERCDGLSVRTLMTFGSQHNGIAEFQVCGSYDFVCKGAVALVKGNAWTDYVQNKVVPAQYYRTLNETTGTASDEYLEHSNFLADINNEREPKNVSYAAKIAKLENFVMYLFDEDKTVIPKESGWFAEVNATTGNVTLLRDRPIYKEDWIGLKKLDKKGGLVFKTTPGGHMDLKEKMLAETFGKYFGPPEKSTAQQALGAIEDVFIEWDQEKLLDEPKGAL
ncbi:target of SBF [Elasticomyces elasticus]|nr:target of SBF [Elasticomyces elasticus]